MPSIVKTRIQRSCLYFLLAACDVRWYVRNNLRFWVDFFHMQCVKWWIYGIIVYSSWPNNSCEITFSIRLKIWHIKLTVSGFIVISFSQFVALTIVHCCCYRWVASMVCLHAEIILPAKISDWQERKFKRFVIEGT